jgi:hypothetical protein
LRARPRPGAGISTTCGRSGERIVDVKLQVFSVAAFKKDKGP